MAGYILINRKGQIWYTDFMVGLLIFIIALIIYYEYAVNLSKQEKGRLDELLADAKMVSSSLVSAGYPANWSIVNIKRIGVTDDNNRINEDKLGMFESMNYSAARRLFGTRFDYFVFFMDKGNCLIEIDSGYGIGHSSVEVEENGEEIQVCSAYGTANLVVNMSNVNPQKLVSVGRLVIYKSEIVKMVVYVWQ